MKRLINSVTCKKDEKKVEFFCVCSTRERKRKNEERVEKKEERELERNETLLKFILNTAGKTKRRKKEIVKIK